MKKLLHFTLSLAVLLQAAAIAQTKSSAPARVDASPYLFNGPVSHTAGVPRSATTTKGTISVAIKLQDAPLVVAVGANAKQNGIKMTAAQQRAYLTQLKAKQDAVMAQVRSMGGVELARVSKGHNAVIVSIDASKMPALKNLGGVVAVRPVPDFELTAAVADNTPDLHNTLNYVGGLAVQSQGVTGKGTRIAMLDTGIDYTHYNLGGSGNTADYAAAIAVKAGPPPPSLFPTAKVIGGYDFVGDVWPSGPLAPDPNPIDLNGHGSHTSDIAGGRSNDGIHVGAAPGSQLYAVKVCSSVASSCSGTAMLEGLEFALDPTNSGTLNNPVDVISMSIGGDFGMREDDVSEMFTEIVTFGVVSVVSAGNSGNIPYIVGHPAATPEVIATAATNSVVATGVPLVINSPASIAGTYKNTATVDWSPITGTTTGDVVYVGRGCPVTPTTPVADPYLASPSGKIALIDRGACAVSLKVDRAANAGAIGVLIGLVAAGDAISFSNGGGTNFVPTLVIIQSYSNTIKGALGTGSVNATISINNAFPLSGNVASYSSRGPNYSYNMLKPDMSAPGTMSAAQPGTGNGETTESGTSFACPITAGSAALLLSANHTLTPLDVKARLMETANPTVYQNQATLPGYLAPLSRVGSGELRVNDAYAGSTAAWDASNPLAVSLSFGTYRLGANQSFKKKVIVHNYSGVARTYNITNTYRDAPNTTGVTLSTLASISVPPNGTASFVLTLSVNAASLPTWTMNGGSQGGNGARLDTLEYAGLLNLSSGSESVNLPWHILPHKAANVAAGSSSLTLNGSPKPLPLSNASGVISGLTDVFSLTGTSPQITTPLPPPGSDKVVIDLRAVGVRLICTNPACTTFGAQFAITTFGQRSHPDVPAEFDVYIDVNNDGVPDLDIFNGDIGAVSGGGNTGQNGVFVVDLAAGTVAGPYYYTVADLDSANAILTVPLSALTTAGGLSLTPSTPFTFSVLAFDNSFTGNLTDSIVNMKYELDMPHFFADQAELLVPAAGSTLTVSPNGSYNGNSPSQTGLLLMYTNGKNGREADIVSVSP